MSEDNRKIVISGNISAETAEMVITRIIDINEIDTQAENAVSRVEGKYTPEPIEIFINSGGGTVYDGFAIIDAMLTSKTPIITYGLGIVGSMALAIYVAGDIRISGMYTRFMYHSIAYGSLGTIQDHEDQLGESVELQKMYNHLITSRTNMDDEYLDSIKKMKKDCFFSSKTSVTLGVSHEVLEMYEARTESDS